MTRCSLTANALVIALVSAGVAGCGDRDDEPVRPATTVFTATSRSAPETAATARNRTQAKRLPGPIRPPKNISAGRPTQVVGGPLFIRTKTHVLNDPAQPLDLTVVLLVKLNRDPRLLNPNETGTFKRGEFYAGNPGTPGDAGDLVDMAGDGGLFKGAGKNCLLGIVTEDSGGFLKKRFGSLAVGTPITVSMKPRKANNRVFRFQTPLIVDKFDLDDDQTRRQIKSIGCNAPERPLDVAP